MGTVKGLIIGFVIALVLIVGAYGLYQWEKSNSEKTYMKGFEEGFYEGTIRSRLYTQQTGNITINENGEFVDVPVVDICGNIIQGQLNQNGGI